MGMTVGAGAAADEAAPMMEMNMTPLIDVMLVLIIMLIITIPIQNHAVNLNMPTPSSAVQNVPPIVDTIEIGSDGAMRWNGAAIADRPALEARLTTVAAMAEQDEVHVRPDKMTAYKWVAAVLASAQRLGVVKLGVVGNEQFLE